MYLVGIYINKLTRVRVRFCKSKSAAEFEVAVSAKMQIASWSKSGYETSTTALQEVHFSQASKFMLLEDVIDKHLSTN